MFQVECILSLCLEIASVSVVFDGRAAICRRRDVCSHNFITHFGPQHSQYLIIIFLLLSSAPCSKLHLSGYRQLTFTHHIWVRVSLSYVVASGRVSGQNDCRLCLPQLAETQCTPTGTVCRRSRGSIPGSTCRFSVRISGAQWRML